MSISAKALRKIKDAFLDEEIIIYLKDMNVTTVTPDGNEIGITAMLTGYLVDVDVDFLYLGLPDGTVLKAIQHQPGQLIELAMSIDASLNVDFPAPDEDVH